MRSAAAFALASLAIFHPACAAHAEQAHVVLSQFREALTLSLTVPSNVVVGEDTRLHFRVQNSGRHAIEGCVGPSRNVWITPEDDTQGNEPISISEHVVDHPGCQQRYRLAPGAHFEPWYRYFPWEDWRTERPAMIERDILPELTRWAAQPAEAAATRALSRTAESR